MEYKKIGRIQEKLSVVALGAWAIGGKGWGGDIDDKKSVSAIQAAVDAGINIVDTAPVYGFGHSEEIVGKALDGRRDKTLVATKCGLLQSDSPGLKKLLSRANIKSEIDLSLRRLNIDHIDIYQTHWPDRNIPLAETYETMAELVQLGKARYIGACNVDIDLLKQIDAICPLAFVQNEFSFLKRDAGGEVIKYCEEKGIAFLAYGPLGGGILTGKYASAPKFSSGDARTFLYDFYSGDNFIKTSKIAEGFKKTAAKHNKPVSAAALNWCLCQSENIIPLAGAKRPQQVLENAQAAGWRLTEEDLSFLNEIK